MLIAPEINGKPGVWIQVEACEKVSLGEKSFSNVVIGPVTYGKWIEDKGDKENAKEIQYAQSIVESIVATERDAVLESMGQA